jgi:hypothetical protein
MKNLEGSNFCTKRILEAMSTAERCGANVHLSRLLPWPNSTKNYMLNSAALGDERRRLKKHLSSLE